MKKYILHFYITKLLDLFTHKDLLDQQFCLSSVTGSFIDLSSFSIEIEDKKLNDYLLTAKAGTLNQANLATLTKETLIKKIEDAINTNTLYHIRILSNGVILFFTQIEFVTDKKVKYILSLEVKISEKKLRIITMY